ncbi:MAG: hypothetical protein WAV21_01965 [Minisyncoccia bacterium]
MTIAPKKLNLVLGVLLLLALVVIGFLLFGNGADSFSRKVECSKFIGQATNRIESYYAEPNTEDTTPSEIFYSQERNSCVAVWEKLYENPANNGTHKELVIFDATTNEAIYSGTIFRFTDRPNDPDTTQSNIDVQDAFDRIVSELKD